MEGSFIPDQIRMWDSKHGEKDHEGLRGSPSPFAQIVSDYLKPNSKILELGCGVGRDSAYFAGLGHSVLATDGSSVVIDQNVSRQSDDNVEYQVLDMRDLSGLKVGNFNVVFANLSLHYYLDKQTREIVTEITKLLSPDGILAFACKSHDITRTEHADEVETSVFVAPNGHATHMFTKEYAQDLVSTDFETLFLDEVDEEYMGRVSGIVRCIAEKT